MKKLICLLHHPLKLTKTTDCEAEDFENENRAIRVYKCKYCGEDVVAITKHINGKFKRPVNLDNAFRQAETNCENYVDGKCSLDNEICYVEQNRKDSGLTFDCVKKVY